MQFKSHTDDVEASNIMHVKELNVTFSPRIVFKLVFKCFNQIK